MEIATQSPSDIFITGWVGSSPSCFKNPSLTVWLETKVLLELNNEIAGASLMSKLCGEMARECPCKRIRSSTDEN